MEREEVSGITHLKPQGKKKRYTTNRENIKIRSALKISQPCTRRKLSEITGLEIPTLCRALFNLYTEDKVQVTHYAKCPKTGVVVMHYALATYKIPGSC